MKNVLIFILLILFISFISLNLSKTIEASEIREHNNQLIIIYNNLPGYIQVALNRFGITYSNNQINICYRVDRDAYKVFITCDGRNVPFSSLIDELSKTAKQIEQGSGIFPANAENVVINFINLMTKYEALVLEYEFRADTGFRISKPLVFDDDPRINGDLVQGTIECPKATCYVGSIMDGFEFFKIGINKIAINFINSNERRMNFLSTDSNILVYKTENDYQKNTVYKNIARATSNYITYYKKLRQGDRTYYSVIKGTFVANGVTRQNQIMELFTETFGCVVPSIKYSEGFEIKSISQKIENKDYFVLDYKNFYCAENNPEGTSFILKNFPSENEIASLEKYVSDYLEKKTTAFKTFDPRTTIMIGKTKSTEFIIPQKAEEAKSFII
ncbi:MAG: hypothetical protein N3G19_03200 [Candidatus Pacearchaeota archaeon]|nr:hypothetical protein [Candidatus Pacearchaeota archaeon]